MLELPTVNGFSYLLSFSPTILQGESNSILDQNKAWTLRCEPASLFSPEFSLLALLLLPLYLQAILIPHVGGYGQQTPPLSTSTLAPHQAATI